MPGETEDFEPTFDETGNLIEVNHDETMPGETEVATKLMIGLKISSSSFPDSAGESVVDYYDDGDDDKWRLLLMMIMMMIMMMMMTMT